MNGRRARTRPSSGGRGCTRANDWGACDFYMYFPDPYCSHGWRDTYGLFPDNPDEQMYVRCPEYSDSWQRLYDFGSVGLNYTPNEFYMSDWHVPPKEPYSGAPFVIRPVAYHRSVTDDLTTLPVNTLPVDPCLNDNSCDDPWSDRDRYIDTCFDDQQLYCPKYHGIDGATEVVGVGYMIPDAGIPVKGSGAYYQQNPITWTAPSWAQIGHAPGSGLNARFSSGNHPLIGDDLNNYEIPTEYRYESLVDPSIGGIIRVVAPPPEDSASESESESEYMGKYICGQQDLQGNTMSARYVANVEDTCKTGTDTEAGHNTQTQNMVLFKIPEKDEFYSVAGTQGGLDGETGFEPKITYCFENQLENQFLTSVCEPGTPYHPSQAPPFETCTEPYLNEKKACSHDKYQSCDDHDDCNGSGYGTCEAAAGHLDYVKNICRRGGRFGDEALSDVELPQTEKGFILDGVEIPVGDKFKIVNNL